MTTLPRPLTPAAGVAGGVDPVPAGPSSVSVADPDSGAGLVIEAKPGVLGDGEAEGSAEAALELDDGALPWGTKVANMIAIILPFVVFIGAVVHAWGWGIGWSEVGIMLVMYLLTGFGVTIGYHRLFTHKSFKAGPVVTSILGVLGSMSVEGRLIRWVAFHRAHHQHSDHAEDPHSPHGHGGGIKGVLVGFYRAHMGWMLDTSDHGLEKYVVDLQKDRLVRRISDLFPLWFALSLIIPTVIGGLISMTWTGALLGLVWGGFVRILMVHHITWSVNSVCHLWGTRPFRSHDESRNNVIVGVLALGEGWHNNHHAFPTSARHGLRWWQFDASYIVIWAMSKLGLVWDVKIPSAERMAAKRMS